jgi:hypothetical protein
MQASEVQAEAQTTEERGDEGRRLDLPARWLACKRQEQDGRGREAQRAKRGRRDGRNANLGRDELHAPEQGDEKGRNDLDGRRLIYASTSPMPPGLGAAGADRASPSADSSNMSAVRCGMSIMTSCPQSNSYVRQPPSARTCS